jgi:hypothetical protein
VKARRRNGLGAEAEEEETVHPATACTAKENRQRVARGRERDHEP